MSHASCIVALSPKEVKKHGGIEQAVAWNMEPFSEDNGGGWFADGSRWDWYVIGGRYTGKFAMGYDPHADPDNLEECCICRGTGMRNDHLGREHRKKEPGYKCNGCQGTGKQEKFSLKPVGNICLRSELSETKLIEHQRVKTEKLWADYRADSNKSMGEFKYGIKEGDTLESMLAKAEKAYLTAYAFLNDRKWREADRLGWFGSTAKTECEIIAEEKGEDYKGKCLHTCQKTQAKIISFGEDADDRWRTMYWPRFIRNLPGDTTLVCVDYHV